jgi:hypothetical protein
MKAEVLTGKGNCTLIFYLGITDGIYIAKKFPRNPHTDLKENMAMSAVITL